MQKPIEIVPNNCFVCENGQYNGVCRSVHFCYRNNFPYALLAAWGSLLSLLNVRNGDLFSIFIQQFFFSLLHTHTLRCFSISFTNDFCELNFHFFPLCSFRWCSFFCNFYICIVSKRLFREWINSWGYSMSANWASAMPDGVSASIDKCTWFM